MIVKRVAVILVLSILQLSATPARAQLPQRSSEPKQVPGLDAQRSAELNAQYYRARIAWRSGSNLMEAKVRIDRVVKARPDDAAARKLRAQVLLALERPGPALVDARRAVHLRPEDGEARLILTEALRLNGKKQAARKALKEAAQHLFGKASHRVLLSWNAEQLGLYKQAEEYARDALERNMSLPAAYYQLARVLVRRRQVDAAAAILKRGFSASVLTPGPVVRDSLLRRVAQHEDLQRYFPN